MRRIREGVRGRSVYDVGRAFDAGEEWSNNRNLATKKVGNKLLLVGYGWAVYGEKDLTTGKSTYFSGWRGYSPTTSKHISQTGIWGNKSREVHTRPRLSDY